VKKGSRVDSVSSGPGMYVSRLPMVQEAGGFECEEMY
jgi:hypothetical protein